MIRTTCFKQDPKIRLKTILHFAIEALEDIGPYGTCVTRDDVVARAKDAARQAKESLAVYRKEYE